MYNINNQLYMFLSITCVIWSTLPWASSKKGFVYDAITSSLSFISLVILSVPKHSTTPHSFKRFYCSSRHTCYSKSTEDETMRICIRDATVFSHLSISRSEQTNRRSTLFRTQKCSPIFCLSFFICLSLYLVGSVRYLDLFFFCL